MHFLLPLVAALATTATCYAADPDKRSSPADKNPRCMERDVDASAGKCVEPSAGTPRHKHPPPSAGTPGTSSGGGASPSIVAPKSGLKGSGGAK